MRAVRIGELRDHLSRYLAVARNGERILVLDRETPIAEIGPVRHRRSVYDAARAELIHLGVIAPRARTRRRRLGRPAPCRGDALAALRAERDAD